MCFSPKGALFDKTRDAAVETAFSHSVNMINDDRSVLIRSRVTPIVDDNAPYTDSFQASRKREREIILHAKD